MSTIETTGVDARNSSPFGASDGAGGGFKDKLTGLAGNYTKGQKVVAGVVVAAVLLGLFMVSRMTGGTEYAPLYTDVSAEDGGAIVAQLEKEGIPHEISAGGSSILVPADKVHETRMKLSSTELPGNSKVGYGVLDSQGLTTSEFGQRVGFQRAMEGELAMTIESLDAVDTAVVHLALPAEQVFAREDDKPSASVLVRTVGNEQLTEDQVRAVVNLVASGIEGMSPEAVTVADSDGNVLSAPGQGVNNTAGGGSRQRQTADFEGSVRSSLEAMLTDVVGAGGANVTVSAQLDFDEQSVTRETFEAPATGEGGERLTLEESTREETYTGADPQTGGVLGPDTPAAAVGGGDTDYDLAEADVRYAVNRAVETTNQAPGRIERLSVAVAVDEEKVTPAQAASLAELIEAGAGIDAERGDVLSVTRTPMDDGSEAREAAAAELKAEEEARAAAARGEMLRNLVIAGVLLAVVLVAFFMHRRAVRRRGPDGYDELLAGDMPAELPPATPAAAAALDANEADVLDLSPAALGQPEPAEELVLSAPPLEIDPAEQERINRQSAVSELIEHQPDEVASLLRSWLGDRRAVQR